MEREIIKWLQTWLARQANGDWEHHHGVKIESLDNPGWSVVIDIAGTGLTVKEFETIQKQSNESDWITCRVKDERFEGFGDPEKLAEILDIFRRWVEP